MKRENLIEIIKAHSDIYANTDLSEFTDTQLLNIQNSLFIELRTNIKHRLKKEENKTKEQGNL
ncbi:MAG: hypothetical protein H0W61_17470 [Bacteroidetes bacterium]|nr:hypothetical protein [Bacteroidota bacterium]